MSLSTLYAQLVKALGLFGEMPDKPSKPKTKNPRLVVQQRVVTRGGKTYLQGFHIDPLADTPAQSSLFTAPVTPVPQARANPPKPAPRAKPTPPTDQPDLFTNPSETPAPPMNPAQALFTGGRSVIVPKQEKPEPPTPTPATAPTEAEARAAFEAEMQPGDTKIENGIEYTLNQNHRWERTTPEVKISKGVSGVQRDPNEPTNDNAAWIQYVARNLTDEPERIEAIHEGLKNLSSMCNYASSIDGAGFGKFDTEFGHQLANAHTLSPKQAAYGLKMIRKYHRQLPTPLIERAEGIKWMNSSAEPTPAPQAPQETPQDTPEPASTPEAPLPVAQLPGHMYLNDAKTVYDKRGGKSLRASKPDLDTQYVYASMNRPVGSWAPQEIKDLLDENAIDIVDSDNPAWGRSAHSYLISDKPLSGQVIASIELTPVSAPSNPVNPDTKPITWTDRFKMDENKLNVGDRKTIDGVTYFLNKNHRWEREPDTATAQPDTSNAPEVESFPGENGMTATVRHNPSYTKTPWGVALKDEDAGQNVPVLKFFPTREKAVEYAKTLVEPPAQIAPASATTQPETPAAATEPEPQVKPVPTSNAITPNAAKVPAAKNLTDSKSRRYMSTAHDAPKPGERITVGAGDAERQVIVTSHSGSTWMKDGNEQTYVYFRELAPKDNERPQNAPTAPPSQPTARDYTRPYADTINLMQPFGFELLARSTPAQRKKANEDAINLSAQLKAQGRYPTPEERRVLEAYTGDGGLNGDINAHYTPTKLAGAMWRLTTRAGFQGGRVLEPSMGAGVFMETAPDTAKLTGVELSAVTGNVAELLHGQKHTVYGGMPFERYNTTSGDEQYDAVIANPPYGSRDWNAASDKPEYRNMNAEEYFTLSTLDRLADNAPATFLTNPGLWDNEGSRSIRARILAKAEIIGVYQLPNSVFLDSNSEVPPVVFVLRKRPHAVGGALSRLYSRHGEKALEAAGIMDDQARRALDGTLTSDPQNIIGAWDGSSRTPSMRYKRIDGTLEDGNLADLAEKPLHESTHGINTPEALRAQMTKAGFDADDVDGALAYAISTAGSGALALGTISEDGKYVWRIGASGVARWHNIEDENPGLVNALEIGKAARRYAHLLNNGNRTDAEQVRQELQDRLEQHAAEYGNPNRDESIKTAVKTNRELAHVLGAFDKDTGNLQKHIVTPVIGDEIGAEMSDKDDAAHVAQYLAGRGMLTPANLAEHWTGANHNPVTAENWLYGDQTDYALSEDGRWMPANQYYSGDAYERAAVLATAADEASKRGDTRTAAKLRAQGEHFINLVPKASMDDPDLTVTPRDGYMPPEVIKAFIEEVIDPNREYDVTREAGVLYVKPIGQTYKPKKSNMSASQENVEEFKKYLNFENRAASISGDLDAAEAAAQRIENYKAAQGQEELYAEQFKAWANSSEYRDQIEDAYNRTMNSFISGDIDPSALPLEGWTGPKLHDVQNQAVRAALREGTGITALDVGVGKTLTGVALIGMLMQQQRAKKLFVVSPRSVVPNWRKNIGSALPGKKITIIGQAQQSNGEWRDESGEEVAAKLSALALDTDEQIVLITRDWYGKIPVRPENIEKYISADLDLTRELELRNDASDAFAGQGRKKAVRTKKSTNKETGKEELVQTGPKTKREIVSELASEMQKQAAKLFKNQNDVLYFEDMGMDAVLHDEAHAYKNLFAAPALITGQKPKYMGASQTSKRANDNRFKMQAIRERMNGQGVYNLTATPTKNNPLEIFSMLTPMTDVFNKMGVTTREFVSRYCDIDMQSVPGLDGQPSTKPAVIGFKNLRELRGIMNRYVFRRTAKEAGLKVPTRIDMSMNTDSGFEMHPQVRELYNEIARSAMDEAKKMAIGGGGGKVFKYMSDMRKLTLDPALYSDEFKDLPNPRYEKAAEIAHNAMQKNGGTLVFMDMGKKHDDADEDADEDNYDDMDLDELQAAAKDAGIPNWQNHKKQKLQNMLRANDNKDATNAYNRLVDHMIAKGIPRERIAVVTGSTAKSVESREKIAEAFNNGELDVLIGSTGVIGEGMNLQKRTTDMVHADIPWDPGTYQQRLGRGERQGNPNEHVKNWVLNASNSFDTLTYDNMRGKQGWMDILWNSTANEAENSAAKSGVSQAELLARLNPDFDEAAYQATQRAQQAEVEAKQRAYAALKATKKLAALGQAREGVEKYKRLLENYKKGSVDRDGTRHEPKPAQIKTYEDAIAKRVKEADYIASQVQNEKNLPDHLRELITHDQPFVVDDNGKFYTPGSLFELGGQVRRVTGVNFVGRTVQHENYAKLDTKGPQSALIKDLGKTTEHALKASEGLQREAIKHVVNRTGFEGIRSRLSPEARARYYGEIHQALDAKQLNRAFVITPDNRVEFRRNWNTGVKLQPGERYMIGTPTDLQLFNQYRAAKGDKLDYEEESSAPIQYDYNPKTREYEEAQMDYLIKSPGMPRTSGVRLVPVLLRRIKA